VILPNPLNEHPRLRVSVRRNAGYESYCPHTLPYLVYSGKRKLYIRILPNFEQSNISVRYTTVSNYTNNATIDHRSPRHQDPLLVNHLILQCLPNHILQRRPRSRGTDLCLVYEGHSNFHALPMFGAVSSVAVMGLVHRAMHDFLPNFQDHNHIHDEHYLRLVRPYPIPQGINEVRLKTTAKVVDIVDRNRGVLVCVDIVTATEAPRFFRPQLHASIAHHNLLFRIPSTHNHPEQHPPLAIFAFFPTSLSEPPLPTLRTPAYSTALSHSQTCSPGLRKTPESHALPQSPTYTYPSESAPRDQLQPQCRD
jgi:hypothetical protein